MPKELAKQYAPQGTEDRIYQNWCDKGYFHTQIDRSKKPFTIVMPPPNVTGQLHMGHAMDETWQDILTRYKRMQGYAALWVPGTDHASIATEAKVVAKMREEGLTKEMVGRDGFLERAWDWKNTYGNRIVSQLKKLGCSCDWQRERFTMDEGCSDAVAGLALGVLARAVPQMLHDLQRVVNGFVALAPLDVHHSADAAVVMLKPGAVQPGGGLALGKVFHTSFAPFPIPLNRAASHICRAGGINKKDAPNRAYRPLVGTSLFLSASYHRCRRFTIPKQKILRKLSEKRLEIWFSKRKLNKIKLCGLLPLCRGGIYAARCLTASPFSGLHCREGS